MNWIIYINVLKLQLSDCAILHFSGVGVAMTRDPATLMVGQYFKRKRELIEIILVSGSGLGIAAMSGGPPRSLQRLCLSGLGGWMPWAAP